MPIDDVHICNLALARLGSSLRIASLTETTVQADLCNLFYTDIRDAVLEDFPWSFAMRYMTLTLSTETHPLYAYVYEMPAGALRVLRVFPAGAVKTTREPFTVYNYYNSGPPAVHARRIASDVAEAQAEYIAQITDPTLFSANFIDALAWRLAVSLAPPLKANARDLPLLEAEYKLALARAQLNDANQGVEEPPRSTRYKEARW